MTYLILIRRPFRFVIVTVLAVVALGLGGGRYLAVGSQDTGAIRHGNPNRPEVALMVNVDWGEEYLPAMLDVFDSKNVKATFFIVGRWARKNPDLLRQIAARGHEIASHGDQHKLATKLSDAELEQLISDGVSTLKDITGNQPAPLFAPPSGDADRRVVEAASKHGLKTILWTLDTVDWKKPSSAVIVRRAVERASAGALILMHPTKPTLDALPEIIDGLRRKSLEPVTVSQVMQP